MPKKYLEDYADLRKIYRSLAASRNVIVHGFWCICEEYPYEMLLTEPNDDLSRVARIFQNFDAETEVIDSIVAETEGNLLVSEKDLDELTNVFCGLRDLFIEFNQLLTPGTELLEAKHHALSLKLDAHPIVSQRRADRKNQQKG